ncbi:MAG: SDR family oxidoreductase [Candidatus Latescibacteria bacterium]|jgi:short-subunit dehydrogenase|nr:SDR family oxidoreductase [Candidatus Latescibacterota bacterium]
MDVAIVSGASSGIGLSVSRKLVEMGYEVYGLARDFGRTSYEDDAFHKVVCDITESVQLEDKVSKLLREAGSLKVLVNNAGVGHFGPHETLSVTQLEQMVRTNLLGPMMLTRLSLRHLRESCGFVIDISSTGALQPGRLGCAYTATKAGLHQFGLSLFEEVRKSGIKVVTIYPDMTQTDFYKSAGFRPHDDPDCHLTPECVADAVQQALSQREGTVVTQIVLKPQRFQIDRT